MGNILGQPFAPWVTKQIYVRQQSLGYVDYNTDDLLYQGGKTPWIRLASSVDIKDVLTLPIDDKSDGVLEKFTKFGVPRSAMIGSKAARSFILQGGAMGVDDNGNHITYQGLNVTTPPVNQFYNGAYGWGETDERGFVPLPGIMDASLVYYNNGALSKAVINMKCFSRNQLALMDALYMRPGYNLLLEFGWTSWLDNETRKLTTNDSFQSPALNVLLGGATDGPSENPLNFEIPRLINEQRKKTYGNYEGVFGKVTNFKWSFNPDGSYDCQTTLTGMGGVIESLKINGATFTKGEKEKIAVSQAGIKALKDAELDEKYYKEQERVLNATLLKTQLDDQLDSYFQAFKDDNPFDYKNPYFSQDAIIKDFHDPFDNFKVKTLNIKDAMIGTYIVNTDIEVFTSPHTFMSFGFFLSLLQNNFLIYNEKGKPLFSFDMDFVNLEEDDNYIINLPGQFSANPLVCYTPYNNVPDIKDENGVSFNVNIPETSLNIAFSSVKDKFIVDSGKSEYLGKLAYVYIHFDYIKKCLSESKRDPNDGSLALLPFLKTVISGICKARGGINNILVHEDINTNKIKFIEEVPQNWASEIPPKSGADEFCKINTYGVKNKVEGSIVRNIDMNGTISKEFASMITIGAQSNGNKVNENATAFSKYNKGLIDRTFIEKNTGKDIEETPVETPLKKEKDTIATIWNTKMNVYKGLFYSVFTRFKWLNENITALENLNITFIKLLQGSLVNKNVISTPFFLPFNLSLDIDGISGIKLYQKFTIDDNVLPPSYDKDSVDLQIKAANHTVSSTDWITKIETLATPKSGEKKVVEIKKTTPQEVEEVAVDQPVEPVVPQGQVTITSQYPLENIFYPEETPKSQIYIHHTAGNQNVKRTIEIWNDRTDHVSTHYITNNNGEAEQLYVDEYWANHLGVSSSTFRKYGIPYRNLNKYSLGIELSAFGGVKLKGGVYKTIYNSTLPESEVAQPLDAYGKPIYYKGYAYYQKYSNAQIANVKNIMTGWMNKYNIPFNYSWDELFNDKGSLPLSKKALRGEKGVYSHNSVRTGKQDVFPQKELLDMFKSIATNQSPPPPANTIVWEILRSDATTSNNGVENQYTIDVKLRGTLNGESIEFEDRSTYGAAGKTIQEVTDEQILFCKEEIVDEGDINDDNDWVNAENTVPID